MDNLKAHSVPRESKKLCNKTSVVPTFESIFNKVVTKTKKAKFPSGFLATQITLKGLLECAPLYIKTEDKTVEVAPYEYNNASFYVDVDTEVFVDILNGDKKITDAIAEGSVVINGDASMAVLFFLLWL